MFADIVGFTALSERLDPEQVKNLVDAVFERLAANVTEFGGRVDKVLGDGMLAMFGAPVAHEDDAERAVRASFAMLETVEEFNREFMARLQVRVGVNTGEVLVGEIRAAGDYTAMGDVVNIASRLSDNAAPGQIVVGSQTHAATNDSVEYEAGVEMRLAGRATKVATWVASQTLGLPGQRRRHRGELVGRDIELSIATQSVDSAFRLRRSLLLLIMGAAGVGKSRFAEEVAQHANDAEAVVLTGRCVPYGEANIWFPLAEAVLSALRIGSDLSTDRPEVELADAVAGLVASDAEETSRIVNGLLYLVDQSGPLQAIEPRNAQDEAARSARLVLEAVADRQPVVLRLVDLHWADELVLALIDDLVGRMVHHPFVVVATARFGLSERWAPTAGRHNNLALTLDPLDTDSATELARTLLPDSPELHDDLVERSGGNPFFLEELAALVASGGMVEGDELPATVRGLVSARLDRLSVAEGAVVEDAAVLGRRGLIIALQKMAEARGVDEPLKPLLMSLVEKDLFEIDFNSQRWQFHSDLVRDVVYNRLTKSDRALRHFGVADYLEQFEKMVPSATLAHHYLRAAELTNEMGVVIGMPSGVDERAVRWLDAAANRALGVEHWDKAADFATQKLNLVGDDPQGVEALLTRARAFTGERSLDKAAADLARAEELAGPESAHAADLAMAWGNIEQRRGNLDGAVKAYDEALAGYRAADDPTSIIEVQRAIGMTHLLAGSSENAELAMKDALAGSLELGDRRSEAWARQNLAWLGFVQGRTTKADERIEKSIGIFTEIGDEIGISWSRGLRAYVRMHQGLFDDAEQLADVVLRDAMGRNDAWSEAMMRVLLASVQLWRGQSDTAVVYAEEAARLFESVADPFGLVQSKSVLGRALVRAGRVDEGFLVLNSADSAEVGSERVVQLARTTKAAVNVNIGKAELALEQLGIVATDDIDPSLVGQSERLVAYGIALLQVGKVSEAKGVLVYAANQHDEIGPSAAAVAALALVVAADGDFEQTTALARAVNDSSRATYLDRLRADLANGLAYAAAGRGDESAEIFANIKAMLSTTTDRLGYALVSLAHSLAAERLGQPSADILRLETEERLAELGIEATGWRRAFATGWEQTRPGR